MWLTRAAKRRFCLEALTDVEGKVGFVDVGSGGKLKYPWDALPVSRVTKIDFDPESSGRAVCISNEPGPRTFRIAEDPRASSLHEPDEHFLRRFDAGGLRTKRTVEVFCDTLDQLLADRISEVDILDVNAEGHDFQVLLGASGLLANGRLLCLKIEFELASVWRGQGWFSEVDELMRTAGYELADLEVDYMRPRLAKTIYHRGEPVWGKGVYVPSATRICSWDDAQKLRKAIALFTLLDLPGRALELVPFLSEQGWAEKIASVFKYAWVDRLFARVSARLGLL